MTDQSQNQNDESKNQSEPIVSIDPLVTLQTKCDEYLTGWKRALADYDNLKKDLVRERGEMRRAISVEFLIAFLPIMNNFDQATKHRPHTDDQAADKWIVGALQIRLQLEQALKEFGAEPINGEGEKFDPVLYESVGSRRDENREDGIILETIQQGWKIGERIVCPAKVIINSL